MALDMSSKPLVPPPSQPLVDSWAGGGRRSKRRAGSADVVVDQSEEEYLAICLLMLSRGLRDGTAEEGSGAVAARSVGSAAAKASQGYECSVCGKVYASYQALGGHKTSHRKLPPPPPPRSQPAEEKVHQCSLCLRTFPSGQALGGHKRLHYEGGADGVKDKEPVKAKPSSAAVLRDFDLNLPAVAVAAIGEEDGEIAPPEAKRARILLTV